MRVFALLIVLAAAKDVQVPEDLSQSNCPKADNPWADSRCCQGCWVQKFCKLWDAEKKEFSVDCNLKENQEACQEGACIDAPAGTHTACSKCDVGVWVPNSDPAVENEWCTDCTVEDRDVRSACADAGCPVPAPPPPTPAPTPTPGCIHDRFACEPDSTPCCAGICARIIPAGQGRGYMCVIPHRQVGEAVAVSDTPDKRTVVVSGATGRSGNLFYNRLKKENLFNIRTFVRNAAKAKAMLGCDKCDESEGVFVGDITEPASMKAVMTGADVLAIFTSSAPQCHGIPVGPFGNCSYPKGAEPKIIDFQGTKAQVAAFAGAGGDPKLKQIVYMSTMDTTVPDNFLDKLGQGHVAFYHLQAEAIIMSSGIPFTIAKACGLGDGEGGTQRLSVGHDDETFSFTHTVKRDDVARVLAEAVKHPAESAKLRVDICSHWFGSATTDIVADVFKAGRYPWQKAIAFTSEVVV